MAEQNTTGEVAPMEPGKVTRRGFLEWMIGLLGGVSALAVAGTAIEFLIPGGKEDSSNAPVQVGTLSEYPVGEGKVVPFKNKPAIVINTEKGLVAFSAVCTHAGCVVTWEKQKKQIFCPCHGGTFDLQGNVVSGPPPSPLKKYRVTTQGDKILLSEA